MKRAIKYIACAAAMMAAPMAVLAQNTNSAYFNEGYLFRHELNPAFANDKNYVTVPGVGNVNFAMRGNLGLSDVLYNRNGKTTTFMNPNVSASEFLSNINDKNKLTADVKIELLSAGFKAFGGYNTIGINARTNLGVTLPGALFRLAKEGPANQTYDISDFNMQARGFAEIALGHSRQINDQLRVGGALKVLIGGADVDAKFNKAQLTLGEDAWTATTDAEINASLKGLTYKTDVNSNTGHRYVNDLEVKSPGPNGSGFAIDLGAEYRLNDDWAFSVAFLDLGSIKWKNNMVATTNGVKTFTTNDYLFNVDDEAPNCFDDEMDRLTDGLSALYELEDKGDMGSRSTGIGATMNLAAEYTLPMYRKLKFGLMNSSHFQGDYSWTEFRLSANVAPVKELSAGINLAAGTYGSSFGWILNVHPGFFNFYIGMDHVLGSLAKQGIPLSSNGSLNLGLNVMF